MSKIFSYIGSLIERKPFKSLLLTLLIIIGMLVGVSQVRLATGNETLVQSDNQVYISNQTMEDSFGGDSILILFESKNSESLLSVENINKMYEIEERLTHEENIFNVISPATIVHQISLKQAEMIIEKRWDYEYWIKYNGFEVTRDWSRITSKRYQRSKGDITETRIIKFYEH